MADKFVAYSDSDTHRGVEGNFHGGTWQNNVAIADAATGTLIELRVTRGAAITKSRLYNALDAIKNRVLMSDEIFI